MEKCSHVDDLVVAKDHSILDPSKWLCSACGTTEWVWACLSCPNIGCGRHNEKHAVEHYEASKHPIAMEVNFKYLYCYVCDEYIVGDNAQGDITAIRSALTAIGTLSLEELEKTGGKLLRSYSHQQEYSRTHADEDDRLITAICHHKKSLLAKTFSAWQTYVEEKKQEKKAHTATTAPAPMLTRSRSSLFHVKKRTMIPGVTGLRNLGNTCYINSVIQALGHLEDFREFFCQLVFGLFSPTSTPLPGSTPPISPQAAKTLLRLNTIDYFQHLSKAPVPSKKKAEPNHKKKGGLNGGGTSTKEPSIASVVKEQLSEAKANALRGLSLSQELHGLLRVLWSGKWAQVSPHGFLHAVWRAIPIFKGHSQHDAQEFLCELLDKVSKEIQELPQCHDAENIVDSNFRGELVSQVTCSRCWNVSSRREPFLDLSLEFPRRFQYTNNQVHRGMCHITEMLSAFTDLEDLEPKSYSCEKCNGKGQRSSRHSQMKTDAKKQLLIGRPPELLRLHLKRFRWCGRNHREKIGTHVAFDEELDISPYCQATPSISRYRLNAVIVHHGAGFRAGHYTVYTYNDEAGSWVHCNDSRVNLVSLEEVLASQAYILFFSRELVEVSLKDMPTLTPICSEQDTQSTLSTIPDLDAETMHTLRQLSRGETEHALDDEVSLSFHRDPTLLRRLSTIPPPESGDLKRSSQGTEKEGPSPKSSRQQADS